MNQVTQLQIYHSTDPIQIGNQFDDFEHIHLQSVYIHNSYTNVSTQLNNNYLYYDTGLFVQLSDGFYRIDTLNKILLNTTGATPYKIVLDLYGAKSYKIVKFSSVSNWQNEYYPGSTDTTSAALISATSAS